MPFASPQTIKMINNNPFKNTNAPANGGISNYYSLPTTTFLSTTLKPNTLQIVGESGVWSLDITPYSHTQNKPIANGFLYAKERTNRYALVRGEGYEIVEASYSKRAIAFKISAKEELSFVLNVRSFEALSPVMALDNRFWFASNRSSENSIVLANKYTENNGRVSLIEKCVLQIVGLEEDARVSERGIEFTLRATEQVYIYLGVGERACARTPKLNELRNGIEARTFNYSLGTPVGQGGLFSELSRLLPTVYGYKTFDENMGINAYLSESANADMEICALVGILAFDVPYEQIICYAKGGLHTAINLWCAFMVTRNHDFLKRGYELLLKANPIEKWDRLSTLSDCERAEKLFIYDIMERASRVLGTEDNEGIRAILERYNFDDKDISILCDNSPFGCFIKYLSLLRANDFDGIGRLRSEALSRYASVEKSLESYLYYFVALNATLGINFYSNDIRPALNFGASSDDCRISNLTVWSRKLGVNLLKDSFSLLVDSVCVFEAVGDTIFVSDFKEEIGGVSFGISINKGATITLNYPPFSKNKPKNSTFRLRLEGGKWFVRVKNNALKVEKA